jgi:FAD/FMN-containing dehydrogenase
VAEQLTNWAGNITFRPAQAHRPGSVAELQALVAGSPRVRVLGSGHSFNDIADTSGALVSLAELPAVFEVDSARGLVKVNGAMRYAEVCRRLHLAGFALPNLASLPHISVAGSVATGTHGSGDGNGNLATAVAGLELVTGDGGLLTLDRADPEFPGAVVGLGALGAVVSVTLSVRPAYEVRQYVYDGLAFAELDERFDEIMGSAYSVSLFTDWSGPRLHQVWRKRIDGDEPDLPGAVLAEGPRHPVPGMSPVHCTDQGGIPGPWFARLPHFRPEFTPSSGEELQSEFLLPRRHALDALHALAAIGDRIAPVLQISEVRTIAADELWLSPNYRQDSVGLHFTWIRDAAAVLPVLELVEKRLAPYEPRPHWGKISTLDPAAVRARYPRLADFRGLAERYDPDGKFGNAFLSRWLG